MKQVLGVGSQKNNDELPFLEKLIKPKLNFTRIGKQLTANIRAVLLYYDYLRDRGRD